MTGPVVEIKAHTAMHSGVLRYELIQGGRTIAWTRDRWHAIALKDLIEDRARLIKAVAGE